MRLVCILFAALTEAAIAAAGAAAAAEQVDIPQSDTTLHAIVFRPEGAGPFPGVVALHGCESLVSRSGKMAPQLSDWGERLAAAGLAAVLPATLRPRRPRPPRPASARHG